MVVFFGCRSVRNAFGSYNGTVMERPDQAFFQYPKST